MPVTAGPDDDANDDDDDDDETSLFFNGTEPVRCSHGQCPCVSAPTGTMRTLLAKLQQVVEKCTHSPSVFSFSNTQ